MILRSKTNLSDDQIAQLSDAEGWRLIYTLKPPKSQVQKKTNQICFTGFSPSEKDRLGQLATDDGWDVVKSVTQSLAYLITGANAGPAKLKKAREQNVIIMAEDQFAKFLQDGEPPDSEHCG
jgi:NAD-dependent DNA ligase